MTSTDSGSASPRPSLWARVQSGAIEQFHIRIESLIVLLVLGAIMSVLSPYFLSVSNFMNIFLATATIGVLAIAATYVLGSGGLDLSLGSVMGFAGVVGAWVAVKAGLPTSVAVAATIGAGALAGFVNGLIITRAFVPAFIVTLGMLGIARGLALVINNGAAIYGLP
ncbi:MAG TPA: ABC transporter permease, partial [Rhodobacteraceae bacterium]|nr:ABC transporter permease [Paracoccaceae bacterium]